MVEHLLVVPLGVVSIPHGGPIELFLIPAISETGVTGMCSPDCGMVHIKIPLLRIGKSSLCSGSSGFAISLSGCLPMSDAI